MDPLAAKLILDELHKLCGKFDAWFAKQDAALVTSRGVPVPTQSVAVGADVVADNWGGLFDRDDDSVEQQYKAPIVADNWGGLFEPSAHVLEERVHILSDDEAASTAVLKEIEAEESIPKEYPHQIQEREEKLQGANIAGLEEAVTKCEAGVRALARPPRLRIFPVAPTPDAASDYELYGTAGKAASTDELRPSPKYSLPHIDLERLYKLGARRELKLGVGPIECVPMELALHSPVGDVELQRATGMYNLWLMALSADIRRIHNGFVLDDPDLRCCVRHTFRLDPAQCALGATLLRGYDGSLDDDPESSLAHLDASFDRAVGRVGQALEAAAALRADAVGAAGGGLLAWEVAAESAQATCSTICLAGNHNLADVRVGALWEEEMLRWNDDMHFCNAHTRSGHVGLMLDPDPLRQPTLQLGVGHHCLEFHLGDTNNYIPTGKTLNREQKEILRSKPVVANLIDELERLRPPHAVELASDSIELVHFHALLLFDANAETVVLGSVGLDSVADVGYCVLTLLHEHALADMVSTAAEWTTRHTGDVALLQRYLNIPYMLISSLVARGSTHGFKMGAIILPSDDHHVKIQTFSFSSDLDSAAVHDIFDLSSGTFPFIDAEGSIQNGFAQCVGGFIGVHSIVAVYGPSVVPNSIVPLAWPPPLSTWLWFQLSAHCVLSCSDSKLQLTIFHCVSCWDSVDCLAHVQRLVEIQTNALQNLGVSVLAGRGKFVDPHTVSMDGELYTATIRLIAVGDQPSKPNIPGIKHDIDYDAALDLPSRSEKIAIVGGGYVALEFASDFNGLKGDVPVFVCQKEVLRGFDEEILLQNK